MMALIADGWLRQRESVERARAEAMPAEPLDAREEGPLEGVWAVERYRLASGPEHPLEGRIFFEDGAWQVLFFVMGARSEASASNEAARGEAAAGRRGRGAAAGGPARGAAQSSPAVLRGSAEGGRYEVRGDTVVFRHLFHLSAGDSVAGLPASALRMEVTAAAEAGREPTRFVVQGDRLTLFFPSGNEIDFVRR